MVSDNTLTYSELQFPTWKLNIIIPALLPAQVCMCSGEWEANELSLPLLSLSLSLSPRHVYEANTTENIGTDGGRRDGP